MSLNGFNKGWYETGRGFYSTYFEDMTAAVMAVG